MKNVLLVGLMVMLSGCKKIKYIDPYTMDLGVKSTNTAIKSSYMVDNVLNIKFSTTEGAKYSVQIMPFGKDEPVFKDGFTADDTVINKKYDLSKLNKMDYDLIFIDIKGSEQKMPIIIK